MQEYRNHLQTVVWQYRAAFERIRCGIAQCIGLDVDLFKSAISIEELHPAEAIVGPPCLALPGQYERVRACAFGRDVAQQIGELQGSQLNVGPTVRFVLKNVLINRGVVYGRGRRITFNRQISCNRAERPWVECDEIALRSSFLGSHFFGHWLRADCATHLLAEQSGKPMTMPTPRWHDQDGYLDLFGQTCVELDRTHVRRLILFHDISHNSHQVRRLRTLRGDVAGNRDPNGAGRIVYLMRGSSGEKRVLINEEEIIETLMRRGALIIKTELISVSQLITQSLGARIIIGLEGSQLTHALFTLCDAGGLLAI